MEWNNQRVVDLNDIAIFEKVATFRSFSAAARTFGLPKSSISRAISRLEAELGVRLFERSTRTVQLTAFGESLRARCAAGLAQLDEAVEAVALMAGAPRGRLRISAGIGFGQKVLGAQLPGFLARYPDVSVSIELSSRDMDLVADGIDVALRMGPLADSSLVATRLGSMGRYLCAAPAYLRSRGRPRSFEELLDHDLLEMPGGSGRPRIWTFTRAGEETRRLEISPRISVNEALLIVRLIEGGAGIGIVSGYLCADAIAQGELEVLFREWSPPPVEVSLVFPTRRELSSMVRAFVDYMRESNGPDVFWKKEPAGMAAELR